MSDRFERTPSRYRDLSKPFENSAAADAALQAFLTDLGELRVKHKIPDLYCVAALTTLAPDGGEVESIVPIHFGNTLKAEAMAAFAYGYEASERERRIGGLIAQAKKAKRPKD